MFAGIGGFDLAARWMGWETAWFSEIDPYASAVLAKHWPGVPNHGDITKIDFATVEPVDLLCGGFPCQDISNAGKRKGITGERSGLWSEYARAIRVLRPRYVVVENVAALLTRGLERVLGDLAGLGYDAEWEIVSASSVGAPHLRERLWIVAYPERGGCGPERIGRGMGRVAGVGPHDAGAAPQPSPLAHADGDRRHGRGEASGRPAGTAAQGLCGSESDAQLADANQGGQPRRGEHDARWSEIDGPQRDGWWAVEPDVGRVAHGIPARVDRLKGLGNAIVPLCAYLGPFQVVAQREAMRAAA